MRLPLTTVLLGAMHLGACEEKKPNAMPSSATEAPAPTPPAVATTAAPAITGAAPASTTMPAFDPAQLNLFAPIPEAVEKPVIDGAVKLGQMLFFDTRLSRANDVSCASCHDLAKTGADGAVTSTGTKKQKGKHNTPTVVNAAGAFAQGWDARSATVEDFVGAHLLDPVIMGMPDDKRLTDTVEAIPAYVAAFKKAYPDEKGAISKELIGRAVGAYVKKLFARARWDRYLGGDKSTATDAELSGFAMFVEAGCTSCHQGKYIGATQSQKLGIAKPWPPSAGRDLGRFEVTKQDVDKGMFKVPTLRNVTRTAPYIHDGSIATLDETIRLMARHQVGRELSETQIKAIAAFLGTLEGDPPKELMTKPTLPPSGPTTPKPD